MIRLAVVVALAGCAATRPAPVVGNTPPPPPPPTATPPAETGKPAAMTIEVYRWACSIHMGDLSIESFTLPRGKPVELAFTSRDVDHDVTFSTGQTVHVAAHATARLALTLDADATWSCPTDVAPESSADANTRQVFTLEPAVFDQWIADEREEQHPSTTDGKVALGKRLYAKLGCIACHTVDGTPKIGPSWAGSWGKTITGADGSTRVVDAGYVRESITQPRAFSRPGFPPTMPTFEGRLTAIELESITAFIASLR